MNSYIRGDITDTPPSQVVGNNDREEGRTLASTAKVREVPPRLLSLEDAARYLGVSPWTVRELEWSGVLPRVRIPLGNGKELRKLLFDRADLDRLIDRWKDSGQ